MATQSAEVFDWGSCKAENDLSTKQYYLVEYSGVDQVDVCDAATDRVLGVLMNEPAANQGATVRVHGIAPVVSDGSGTPITVGAYVGANSSGKAVIKSTADYSVCGMALDASSADGTVIRVLLFPGAFFRTAAG